MESKLHHHLLKAASEFEASLSETIVSQLLEKLTTEDLACAHEELLTDEQLCLRLQISTSHFYKLKKKFHSTFPVYDIGGAKRYKLSEVENFFQYKTNTDEK